MKLAKPQNAQHEPSWGLDGETTVSLRNPHMTTHLPHRLCETEAPHATSECGIWNPELTEESK